MGRAPGGGRLGGGRRAQGQRGQQGQAHHQAQKPVDRDSATGFIQASLLCLKTGEAGIARQAHYTAEST